MKNVLLPAGLFAFALLPAVIHAAPPAQPVLKSGPCPSGYYSSGNYCIPNSSARFAIAKQGPCPSGYYSSGDYCLAASDSAKFAIIKSGPCPSGYYSSGNYCLSSQ